MAAAAKPRPWRSLGIVAAALIAIYLGLFLGPAQKPALGLDLRGGTEVVLKASPLLGSGCTSSGSVSKTSLDQAVGIIRDRVNGLGVGGAEVSTQGSDNIIVDVPGKGLEQVKNSVGKTALLRFRQVMAEGVSGPTVTTSASPSAAPTTSPGTGKSGTGKGGKGHAKSSSQGMALSSVLRKSTPPPSPSGAPTTPAAPTPTPTASAAGDTSCSATAGNQPLPNSEAPSLTQALIDSYNNWDCTSTKTNNPTEGNDTPTDYIISCGSGADAGVKYLLGPTAVAGTQVKSASSALDSQGTGQWQVNLSFNGSGSSAWQQVTARAYTALPISGSSPPASGVCPSTTLTATTTEPAGCNAVAITLDGQVPSAPFISQSGGIAGGNAQITGNFSQSSAGDLANILKYGSLPLKFTIPTATSVSATLGAQQLRGGLIAGAIGLGLVIIFSLLYYRALGFVTIGSLAVSGLILYGVTTLLGASSVGYTLSLPGIAGFIVAVGITADSFVVFFERLRDEVREGRRLRSGVERAWPRARRTILSADTVSLLAAVILYVVSIGDVRGFAFTLGLSTISDLFIVFLFTKPLITLLARRPAFDQARPWTGVGRARAGVKLEADEPEAPRRRRTREA